MRSNLKILRKVKRLSVLCVIALLILTILPAQAATWQIETVDSENFVGEYPSLALDSSGRPRISYAEVFSNSGIFSQKLKYAARDGSSWQIETVDDSTNTVGSYTSLALDSNDRPHISYYDSTNRNLKYAVWDGSSWQIEIVDDGGSSGSVGQFTSLALDSSDHPHISYYDASNVNLKYAFWDGSSWQIEAVDSAGVVGLLTTLALDSSGRPHIGSTDGSNLKYAAWDGSSWQIETIDILSFTHPISSLALDASGRPLLSYTHRTGDLKYAAWDGTAWQIMTVESIPALRGFEHLAFPSLALDGSGNPNISYANLNNPSLKYAAWDGSSWQIETAVSDFASWTSLALAGSGAPHIGYHNGARDLRYTTKQVTDSTPPVITITAPAEGASYTLGQVVNADYTCQDEADGSGLASCDGDIPNGSPIDTTSVGPKSFTIDAMDNAGNPASLTHHYSVVYDFGGFPAPVNGDMVNQVKAGQGVPVKFSLGDDFGLDIFASGYPRFQTTVCSSSDPVDPVEETVSAGQSGLSYNPDTGQYTYVWKTDKNWANKCGALTLKFTDNSEHIANFKFTK